MVNEQIVLDFYLELVEKDEIEFLQNKPELKKKTVAAIEDLRQSDSIHHKIEVAKVLWKLLFEGAMSHIEKNKHGYDDLFKYFDEYVDFEELIFASDSFYRDHTIHCLWVYFLGEYLCRYQEFDFIIKSMLPEVDQHMEMIQEFVEADLLYQKNVVSGALEAYKKLITLQGSIRCITALTHDLGYPLKKIQKINKSISKILPHFAIDNFEEFDFYFANTQVPFIDRFLEFISIDFDAILLRANNMYLNSLFNRAFDNSSGKVKIKLDEIQKMSNEDKNALINMMTPRVRLLQNKTKFIRYAHDFEQHQHGILSAFLLMKKLRFFRSLNFTYAKSDDLELSTFDMDLISAGGAILSAIADHTSDGYQIKSINNPSAILTLVDELEEFSRISRANQNRQYINEFCKTDLYVNDKHLCIDFLFDNLKIENLDPELAFTGRCKRFLSLFDIHNLDEDLKIRVRCIGKLPANTNEYCLEIGRKFARITVNGQEQDIPTYLKSRHFYSREEYSH